MESQALLAAPPEAPLRSARRRVRPILLASLSLGLLAAAALASARRPGRGTAVLDSDAGRVATRNADDVGEIMAPTIDLMIDDASLVERFEIIDPLTRNRLHRVAVATLRRDALRAVTVAAPLRVAVRYAPLSSSLPPLWSRAIVTAAEASDGGGDGGATVRVELPLHRLRARARYVVAECKGITRSGSDVPSLLAMPSLGTLPSSSSSARTTPTRRRRRGAARARRS